MEFSSKFMPFFVQICVEKNLAQKCVCGEKMTNMRSGTPQFHTKNVVNVAAKFFWTSIRKGGGVSTKSANYFGS